MIRELEKTLQISASVLVNAYRLAPEKTRVSFFNPDTII